MADCKIGSEDNVNSVDNLKCKKFSSAIAEALGMKKKANERTIANKTIERKKKESKGAKLVDLDVPLQDLSLHAEVKKMRFVKIVDLNKRFLEAIDEKCLVSINFYIRQRINLNCLSSGYTPLTRALLIRDTNETIRDEIVDRLVEAGANPFLRDNEGHYPLIEAVKIGALSLVKIMVGEEPIIDADDQLVINKALHEAVNMHHLRIIKFLVEKNADVNYEDENGLTVLDKAKKNFFLKEFLINETHLAYDFKQNTHSDTALVNEGLGIAQKQDTDDDMKVLPECFQSEGISYLSDGAHDAGVGTMETNNS